MHVKVTVREQRVAQRSENPRFVAAEMIGEDQVQCSAGFWFLFVMPARIVPASAVGNLLGGEAEQEEVVFTRGFCHFDSSAIAGTNGERTVHHEFHVAGTAGFVPRGGNLVGDVAGWYQVFRERNPIIGEKQNTTGAFACGCALDGSREIF